MCVCAHTCLLMRKGGNWSLGPKKKKHSIVSLPLKACQNSSYLSVSGCQKNRGIVYFGFMVVMIFLQPKGSSSCSVTLNVSLFFPIPSFVGHKEHSLWRMTLTAGLGISPWGWICPSHFCLLSKPHQELSEILPFEM